MSHNRGNRKRLLLHQAMSGRQTNFVDHQIFILIKFVSVITKVRQLCSQIVIEASIISEVKKKKICK